ncbi:MAG TPA: glycerate dehydrogenase [Opitutae bacterium]|nr:glycerate dehydrogenase [Puniceicoccaceae bacterium]HBR94223.1 glycerate dehydrogenase [Opitutae bacterium]|tara:strand:+ start:2798 stop:3814 length:1017 start_codon:yes stop_codon:yes gene_type:complete
MTHIKNKPRSLFLIPENRFREIYNAEAIVQIAELTKNDGQVYCAEDVLSQPEAFADVEIVFSGWGAPVLDEALLDALPALKAFFYGAGSVRNFVTEAFWARGIILTSAYKANAVPVADYTMASVIFALKRAWTRCQRLKEGIAPDYRRKVQGVYHGSKVGVISLGAIGQLVCERLTNLDLDVFAYDPFAGDDLFESLNVTRVERLEDLFPMCDVVSLHAPWLPQTENLVTGAMLESLPDRGTFINTSRGAIVDEPGMLKALQARPDLFAVLDLLQNEKTYHSNPITALPNVFMTPHVAGSQGHECHRMGALAVEECRRYLNGEPQVTPLTRETAERLA